MHKYMRFIVVRQWIKMAALVAIALLCSRMYAMSDAELVRDAELANSVEGGNCIKTVRDSIPAGRVKPANGAMATIWLQP